MKPQFDPDDKATETLYRAFLGLRTRDECAKFLRAVATNRELAWMAHRLRVAELVLAGHTYREIQHLTGASSSTIRHAVEWVKNDPNNGFRFIFERLGEEE